MFAYQLRTASGALRRNPGHTAIVAGGIALGVAVSTLFATVRHSFARDPIPSKSDVLHYVRMDSWGADQPYPGNQPPTQITYQDMLALLRSDIPVRQSAMFKSSLYVFPDPSVGRPRREMVRLCHADFFPMFDVPFRHGSGWTRADDEAAAQVVVLNAEINDRLFGGEDSVGRTLRIEDRDLRVVGVLDDWEPKVKFYDLTQGGMQRVEQIYMPFGLMRPMEIRTAGNSDGWKNNAQTGWAGLLTSETVWLQFWVELPTRAAVQAYRDFLDAYTLEQRRLGRFPRPLDNRVTPVREWMKERKVVPKEVNAMLVVSLLFLLICALNLIGLLLGKFLARASEIGVRRAMGARRWDIFAQHIVECELVALLGGAVGLGLSALAIFGVNVWARSMTHREAFFALDWSMALFAAGAALVAGLIAGVYPAWRVCRIAPATHLKNQ